MQFLDDSERYPNLLGPVWKSNYPLNIITGCSTLGYKNCNQAFVSLSHRYGGILAHCSLQNCFSSATLDCFQAWTACVRLCQSTSMEFKSRLWRGHSKTFILFHSFESFWAGLASVFQIILLLHNLNTVELWNRWLNCPSGFFGKVQNSRQSNGFLTGTLRGSHICPVSFSLLNHEHWP